MKLSFIFVSRFVIFCLVFEYIIYFERFAFCMQSRFSRVPFVEQTFYVLSNGLISQTVREYEIKL